MKKLLLIVLILAASCFGVSAQSGQVDKVVAGGVTISSDARRETFDIVWRTVKEKHFDPSLGGLDWQKVREQYAPRAAAAKTDAEFYDVLRQMLSELHQSHFNIIPPEAVVEDDSREPKEGGIGVDLRLVDGQPTITRVESGSRAAGAGLHPGLIIKKMDDTTADQIFALFAKSKESRAITKLRITRAFLAKINGAPETAVRIAYLDGRDQQLEVTVKRERLKGEMSQRFGNFPPQYTEFEAGRLQSGVGYIRFNVFVISLEPKLNMP